MWIDFTTASCAFVCLGLRCDVILGKPQTCIKAEVSMLLSGPMIELGRPRYNLGGDKAVQVYCSEAELRDGRATDLAFQDGRPNTCSQ